jgi:hypothetical protein
MVEARESGALASGVSFDRGALPGEGQGAGPEAYRLVAVEMHLHKALPNFFDELHRVRDRVEVYAAIDARLQSIGRPSKLGGGGNA